MSRIFTAIAALLLAGAACKAAQTAAQTSQPYGILLLAHGGDPEWNATVARTAKALDARAPTELALGMADVRAMQAAVDKLEARGAGRIVAVPLFVHSRSEVLDQARYALGLRREPSYALRDALAVMATAYRGHAGMAHMNGAMDAGGGQGGMSPEMMARMMTFSTATVRHSAPVVMTPALDDSAEVAQVLSRRAKALSRAPKTETVILVGHGPNDEADNKAWLATMKIQARRVEKTGPYRAAVALTIRDDAPPAVRRPALAALRAAVERADKNGGRAIVVPYLISRGGIEGHVAAALHGLDYAWDARTLCPDPAIDAWAADIAARYAR